LPPAEKVKDWFNEGRAGECFITPGKGYGMLLPEIVYLLVCLGHLLLTGEFLRAMEMTSQIHCRKDTSDFCCCSEMFAS
jgi:hypothetical protein